MDANASNGYFGTLEGDIEAAVHRRPAPVRSGEDESHYATDHEHTGAVCDYSGLKDHPADQFRKKYAGAPFLTSSTRQAALYTRAESGVRTGRQP